MTRQPAQIKILLGTRILAGIEAGVLGALGMLAWNALASHLLGLSVWTYPNLAGSVLTSNGALLSGLQFTTFAGMALTVFTGGILGILFAFAASGIRGIRRIFLLGLLTGLVWFYFFHAAVARHMGALVWIYSPPRVLIAGHLVYGLALGLYPFLLRSIVKPETRLSTMELLEATRVSSKAVSPVDLPPKPTDDPPPRQAQEPGG